MGRLIRRLRDDAAEWCQGRSGLVRAPLLAWFAYILVRHLAAPMYHSLFGALNLGLHEFGHFAFRPLGEFMMYAGGSLLQCLAPVLSVGMFVRQRDYFAIAVCFGWLSTNLFEVATYAADARAMNMPLVSVGGGDTRHDWNYLLEEMGMLRWDAAIGFLFRVAATLSMALCLAAGTWLVWKMAKPDGGGEEEIRGPQS